MIQLNKEKAGRRARHAKLPPTFLIVPALPEWLCCLATRWDIWWAESWVCLWVSNRSICVNILLLNFLTCFLVYLMNATLDHLHIIMIVYTGHSLIYIITAAPGLIKCVPISSLLIPDISSPSGTTSALRASTSSFDAICSILAYLHTADTGISSVAPAYLHILCTVAAHWWIGHKSRYLGAICVTISIFPSFFCHSIVIDTQSASSSHWLLWENFLPSLENNAFLRRRIPVLRFSDWGTFRYSQDLIATKKASIDNWEMAFCVLVTRFFITSLRCMLARLFVELDWGLHFWRLYIDAI